MILLADREDPDQTMWMRWSGASLLAYARSQIFTWRDPIILQMTAVLKLEDITKTRLFQYTENFTSKNWKCSDKKKTLIFFIFLLKT